MSGARRQGHRSSRCVKDEENLQDDRQKRVSLYDIHAEGYAYPALSPNQYAMVDSKLQCNWTERSISAENLLCKSNMKRQD